jgi:autotransporter-associated beta strand protein
MRRHRMLFWLSAILLLKVPQAAQAVTVNQVDTFTASTDAWTDGHAANNVLVIANGGPTGAGDNYLQVSSGVGQAEPRLLTFNQTQWKGNYTSAGVASVSMELKNFGAVGSLPLPIRITIRDLTGGQTIGGYSSTTAFSLPADGQWHLATFQLNAASLTAVASPTDPLAAVLTNVQDFRLLSSASPSIIGDQISAQIGVDDITALAPPTVAWTGASSTSWNAAGNWTGAIPGATTGTTNTSTATFNRNATNSPTTIDAGRNLQNLTFDTANVNSLTVGAVAGPTLLLTSGGTIQTTSTVANFQTINAPLVLEGNYNFTSGATSSAATLTFGGGITPGPTTGVTTLTLNGGNTGANTIKGVLANNGAGLLAVTKSGSGTWLLSGANTYSGGTTVSAGTLEFDTAPTLSNNVAFQINGGTLRFKVSGPATVGTGVNVTVNSGATLELAGTASALANGLNRANIANGSTTPAGVLVTGTNQVVGKIDGTGNTQVNAGDSLTANHIVQAALTIGGTSTGHATVTIGASNASGNPTAVLGGAFAAPSTPSPISEASRTTEDALGESGDSSAVIDSQRTVPEPSTLLLFVIAVFALTVGRGRVSLGELGNIQRL